MASQASPDRYVRFIRLCLSRRWATGAGLHAAGALTQAAAWDWRVLLDLARRARVAPLLYDALKDQTWVDPQALHELHRQYYLGAARSTLLLRELERILARFRAADLASLVVKGLALGQSVYGNVALRSGGDLDLLVPADRAGDALRLLEPLGYASMFPNMRTRDLVLDRKETALVRDVPGGRVAVDLHWRLFPDYVAGRDLALTWAWETSAPLSIGAEATRMLGPEARLLYLAAHCALSHGRDSVGHDHAAGWAGGVDRDDCDHRLLWYADIATLLAREAGALDWDLVLDNARRIEVVIPLKDVAGHVVAHWGVPIDASVVARLGQLAPSPAEARVSAFHRLETPPRTHPTFFLKTAGLPTWRDRLRHVLNYAVPSPTYMRWRYKVGWDGLLPVAYLGRWLTGARSALAVAWAALRRRLNAARRQP